MHTIKQLSHAARAFLPRGVPRVVLLARCFANNENGEARLKDTQKRLEGRYMLMLLGDTRSCVSCGSSLGFTRSPFDSSIFLHSGPLSTFTTNLLP